MNMPKLDDLLQRLKGQKLSGKNLSYSNQVILDFGKMTDFGSHQVGETRLLTWSPYSFYQKETELGATVREIATFNASGRIELFIHFSDCTSFKIKSESVDELSDWEIKFADQFLLTVGPYSLWEYRFKKF